MSNLSRGMGARAMRLAALSLVVILSVTSCSSSKSRVGGALGLNTDLVVNFDVQGNINPDAQNQPSPVFLRLYELNDPRAFEKADFIDLFEREEAVLGSSLIARQQLTRFVPGQSRTEKVVLKPGTRYVGIYAEFLQYQDARPKVVFQVTENNVVTNIVNVQLSGNNVFIINK